MVGGFFSVFRSLASALAFGRHYCNAYLAVVITVILFCNYGLLTLTNYSQGSYISSIPQCIKEMSTIQL